MLEKLHGYEVEPYSLAVINAVLTHFPHFSSGSLDDSIISMDTNVDDKALGISWDVVKTVQKFFFPGQCLEYQKMILKSEINFLKCKFTKFLWYSVYSRTFKAQKPL